MARPSRISPPASPPTTSDPAAAAIGLFVGLATLDCLYRVAAPPGPNQKITALDQEIAAGGPAANAAITFAALGGHATLVTDLGTHPLARAAADDLIANGVAVRAVEPESARVPAVSSIYLTAGSGDRSVVSVNASAGSVPPPDWLGQLVEGADVVLLDGHHPELALAAARVARQERVPVLLDAGSWKPVFERLLPLVDVAICSADLRVPAASGDDIVEDDPASIAKDLLRRGPEWVAISFGGDPARRWPPTRRGRFRSLRWWSATPWAPVTSCTGVLPFIGPAAPTISSPCAVRCGMPRTGPRTSDPRRGGKHSGLMLWC